nr:hypothetical protein GCM10025699_49020 [Microbacterium flavescens]
MLPAVHEVILVDGNSVDDTVATAQRVMPDIRVVHQTRKGKGNALACGFEAATGDIIVMFDADGSADPAEIPRFVEALTSGADVAKGSRFVHGGGSEDITHFRALGNWGLNALTNVLLGTKYTDLCYGYNAFWKRIVPSLELLPSDLAPGPTVRCTTETASRSRRSSTAASPPSATTSSRCRASRSCASTASAT